MAKISVLNLTLENYPTKVVAMDRTYELLRDFLQPESAESSETTMHKIAALLPGKAPMSPEMLAVVHTFIELAEQIPYYHPSLLKLVDLLVRLGRSTKFIQITKSKVLEPSSDHMTQVTLTNTLQNSQTEEYYCFQQLGQTLRDNLIGMVLSIAYLSDW